MVRNRYFSLQYSDHTLSVKKVRAGHFFLNESFEMGTARKNNGETWLEAGVLSKHCFTNKPLSLCRSVIFPSSKCSVASKGKYHFQVTFHGNAVQFAPIVSSPKDSQNYLGTASFVSEERPYQLFYNVNVPFTL